MKKILLFDPSQGTQNLGDFIIKDSIDREMKYIYENNFVVRYSTHTPICKWYQLLKPGYILNYCRTSDYKFICGTNIFKSSLVKINSDWNIGLFSIPFYKEAVAIGCGTEKNSKVDSIYTKFIYKKILSKNYIHSTRDEKTKKYLESLGLKALNTGCPTMWKLSKEHCKTIPPEKKKNVIFTLTDYKKDKENDQKLINILKKNYEKVYYWVQGTGDFEYFNNFENINNIEIIEPSIEAYKKILENAEIEYVGTRLHAGIFALQHKLRSIIIAVDNRTRDIKETYNIIALERDEIEQKLEKLINSNFKTEININEENIKIWKEQFKG